ncbi:MAG: helix-turn-helix transcriptional regulator [Thermodesulfovibrionales bacterium]|nr:helix-turn-helix transcriptional regulator [Thermodesulfovibrionales bacterium]MDP3112517.1 helix-turn-helix transcriptional regulator [Thermodesulfovibrionales bacterium]
MELTKYAESILQSTRESSIGMEYDLRFDLVDFIRMKLKENGMTQKVFAQKIKMKESQLTRILKAESNITLETVARIYNAFGCRPTITERHEISEAVSEDRVYKQATIYEPQNKYMNMIASVN